MGFGIVLVRGQPIGRKLDHSPCRSANSSVHSSDSNRQFLTTQARVKSVKGSVTRLNEPGSRLTGQGESLDDFRYRKTTTL